MNRITPVGVQGYVYALAFTGVAVVVRYLFDPWLHDSLPYPTLFGSVALSAWWAGWRAGALSALAGLLAAQWLFIPPRGEFASADPKHWAGVLAYTLSVAIIIALADAVQRANKRLQAHEKQLEEALKKEKDALTERNEALARLAEAMRAPMTTVLDGGSAELEALRSEFNAVLDTLPVGVLIAHDAECRRITTNRVGQMMMRVAPRANLSKTADASERPTHFRLLANGIELEPHQLPLQRAVRGERIRNKEVEIEFDDGSRFSCLISA